MEPENPYSGFCTSLEFDTKEPQWRPLCDWTNFPEKISIKLNAHSSWDETQVNVKPPYGFNTLYGIYLKNNTHDAVLQHYTTTTGAPPSFIHENKGAENAAAATVIDSFTESLYLKFVESIKEGQQKLADPVDKKSKQEKVAYYEKKGRKIETE